MAVFPVLIFAGVGRLTDIWFGNIRLGIYRIRDVRRMISIDDIVEHAIILFDHIGN